MLMIIGIVHVLYLMITLWEFQNGKVGLNSPKIEQDTRKNINIQILKNNVFVKKICLLKQSMLFCEIWIFRLFLVSRLMFELYRPTLPFWISQSVVITHK